MNFPLKGIFTERLTHASIAATGNFNKELQFDKDAILIFEPRRPEGPGLAIQCNTRLCDRGLIFIRNQRVINVIVHGVFCTLLSDISHTLF